MEPDRDKDRHTKQKTDQKDLTFDGVFSCDIFKQKSNSIKINFMQKIQQCVIFKQKLHNLKFNFSVVSVLFLDSILLSFIIEI
jgi:hypothetical protein